MNNIEDVVVSNYHEGWNCKEGEEIGEEGGQPPLFDRSKDSC